MRPPTHGVTLWPEWGFGFAHLGKDRENRTWPLPDGFLGKPLAIHAGAWIGGLKSPSEAVLGLEALYGMAERAGWELEDPCIIRGVPNRGDITATIRGRRAGVELDESISCRSIVAVAIFDGNEHFHAGGLYDDATVSPWAVGPYAWRAAEVVTLKRPVRRQAGALGLWRLTPEEQSAIAEQL